MRESIIEKSATFMATAKQWAADGDAALSRQMALAKERSFQ